MLKHSSSEARQPRFISQLHQQSQLRGDETLLSEGSWLHGCFNALLAPSENS